MIQYYFNQVDPGLGYIISIFVPLCILSIYKNVIQCRKNILKKKYKKQKKLEIERNALTSGYIGTSKNKETRIHINENSSKNIQDAMTSNIETCNFVFNSSNSRKSTVLQDNHNIEGSQSSMNCDENISNSDINIFNSDVIEQSFDNNGNCLTRTNSALNALSSSIAPIKKASTKLRKHISSVIIPKPEYTKANSIKNVAKTYGNERFSKSNELTILHVLILFLIAILMLLWVYIFPQYLSTYYHYKPGLSWGYISCANLFLCMFPAMRNSLFNRFLFQPFERSIVWHKWIALFAILTALIHTFYYLILWYSEGILLQRLQRKKAIFAQLSLFFMLVILASSTSYVRRHHFNVFQVLHFSFFGVFVFGALHAYESLTFFIYSLIAASLYLVELILRQGFSSIFCKIAWKKRWNSAVAQVELFEGDIIRLRIPYQEKCDLFTGYTSGQYVFLNIPMISYFETHPFSISSAPYESCLEFHIKPLGDFTHKLCDKIKNQSMNQISVSIDGPYGRTAFNYRRYENLILVGGGIGNAPLISIIKDLVYKSSIKNVFFIWINRDPKSTEWLLEALREIKTRISESNTSCPVLHINGYITRFGDQSFKDSYDIFLNLASLKSDFEKAQSNSEFVIETKGRPNIGNILNNIQSKISPTNIEDSLSNRQKNNRTGSVLNNQHLIKIKCRPRVGVLSCGPYPLVNSLWDICQKLNKDNKNECYFDCHKETFNF